LSGAFPNGRTVFGKCEDVDLLGHLTALKNWFTPAHVTAVGAAHQTSINGLVTQWTAIWTALGTAKGELTSDRGSRDEVKLAYQNCLFTVVLNLALKFPNDEAKFNQYVPEGLLEDAQDQAPPPKPTLSGEWVDEISKIRLVSDAAEFRVQRRMTGAGDEAWEDNVANATSPLELGDMAPGSYDYRVIAVNAAGESEPSDPVTVVVP
jgi:hypothetical protein